MAMNAFLTVPGIKGSARQKGREGKITVLAATHEVVADLHPVSGLPMGTSKHKYLVVSKEVDLATPKLHAAIGKPLTNDAVVLEFWRMPPTSGVEEIFYSIGLENAQIVSIRLVMPDGRLPGNSPIPEYEEVAFTYTGIQFGFRSAKHQVLSSQIKAKFALPDLLALEAMGKDLAKSAVLAVAAELQVPKVKPPLP